VRLFIQLVIEGIEGGSIYALWAIGYGLVYQVLGLMNFAFGDALLLSLYFIAGVVVSTGMSPWFALMLAVVLIVLISTLIERQVYSRFLSKGQGEAGFIAALACAYILRNIATAIWGQEPIQFPNFFGNHVFHVWGLQIASGGLIVFGLAVSVMVALSVYLRVTKIGRGIVLLGQDRTSAALVGIPVRTIVTIVYGVSGAIGLLGAVLFANQFQGVNSNLGFYITFQAFIVATVGGAGSLAGSVIGGLTLGLVESLAIGYISGGFAQALGWTAMAIMVLVRPQGILGRSEIQRV
jgi:branched-chain amino acid transport system permease protein